MAELIAGMTVSLDGGIEGDFPREIGRWSG